MKTIIAFSLSLLASPVIVGGAEICGQVHSFHKKGMSGHFATVVLRGGRALSTALGQSEVPMNVASIASGLTVCFEERLNGAGAFYEIGSISK